MWGQNFFRSAASARRFAAQLDTSGSALTVEIGPGAGAVTKALAKAGRPLVAVEIDPHWAERLGTLMPPYVTVVNQDFLGWSPPEGPLHLIGNLPFGSGTDILRRCLELGPDRARQGVLLMQREYALKRVGHWGGTLFNAQWEPWFSFRGGLEFARREFTPVPRTDTMTLLVEPDSRPLVPWQSRAAYQEFVRLVFTTGHLTVGAAGQQILRDRSAAWLHRAEVTPGTRVKDLDARHWAALFLAYERLGPRRSPPGRGRRRPGR
ncbi:23S ribosomal RNA methyltransferase Erm [Streptomyces sp. ACA25]|uniref:23S ribosomal RNA methyltransferase Erm n=1 Tax=Streptomyces sp. ACA25 TaxID=3022596 RepID=UPI003FA6EA5A